MPCGNISTSLSCRENKASRDYMSNAMVAQNSLVGTGIGCRLRDSPGLCSDWWHFSVIIVAAFLLPKGASCQLKTKMKYLLNAVYQDITCVYSTPCPSWVVHAALWILPAEAQSELFAFLQSLDPSTSGVWKLHQKDRASRVKCALWALALSASLPWKTHNWIPIHLYSTWPFCFQTSFLVCSWRDVTRKWHGSDSLCVMVHFYLNLIFI